ncbi:TPA: ATP-dependent Clp protease proteolytic subunit [Vibrio vulnificus]|uniref:ATP-dependent Clp protease proteolytic subunit n=1 Tax=Vibrio vulnificus TaxID=672 RepID=A0A8H9TFM1_VIBVL|nr:ATP-dependent Clp protease proteolytic subunit [Vibrio vulnificus]HAS8540923.1 ATP-dependent Clp protease proteolytic subunit [Vibrio vulnificus]
MNNHYPMTYMDKGRLINTDASSFLFEKRLILLDEQFTDSLASRIITGLLALQFKDENKDIELYLNSPGGSVTAGLSILDVMYSIKPKVNVTVIGQACSMGAFLSACATGERRIGSSARIMIHQPSGGFKGTADEIENYAEEIQRLRRLLDENYSANSGIAMEVLKDMQRKDNYMTPQQAVNYGLMDKILIPRHTSKKEQ